MTILFLCHDIEIIAKHLGKEKNWIAIVDSLEDAEIPKNWNKRVFLSSYTEKLMFKELGNDEELRRKMADWFKAWPNIPILNGKSLKQLLEYRGTSLWWWGETVFFKNSFKGYISFREVIIRLEALKYMIQKHDIEYINIYGNGLMARCAKTLCQSLDIKCTVHGNKEDGPRSFYPWLVYKFKRFRGFVRGFVARANKGLYACDSSPKVLAMSYYMSIRDDVYIRKMEEKEQTRLPGDMMLYSVLKEIQKKIGEPRCMYIDRRYPFKLDSVKNLRAPAFPMDLYFKLQDRELAVQKRRLKKLWKRLRISRDFRDSLKFNDVDLWPLVRDYVAFLFIKQFPEAVDTINTMGRMLDSETPEVILISDETGFYGRALTAAASDRNIRTLGLQHGNIAFLEIEHYHQGEGKELACPIPDITAVGGEIDRQTMLDSGLYTEKSVVVTGRPRYDNLAHMGDFYDREAVRERYGVGDRKMVLLTTVRYPVIEDREVWLRAMVKASREISDAFFIVKPHPGEETLMHQNIIEKFGGNNIRQVGREADTKELLFACDVAVNAGSTVGLEAILMGKPFVMVNLTGRKDITPYAEKGSAIAVRKEKDIVPELKRGIDDLLPENLAQGISRFVEEYAFDMDGRASERVVKLFQSFIKP